MKTSTSKRISFYTQGQRFAARVLFIVWLLASGSPEGLLAAPEHQMVPATTTSPGDSSLISALPTLPPGGILHLPPDSPGAFWGGSAGSSPVLERALQQRMSQEAVLFRERDLLRISPKVSPVSEHFSFEARGGERVCFACQQGQWRAEVSSHIGSASRRAVLPVVCSQGTDVVSSLEVVSRCSSWQRQRQIYSLGEFVYVGELGLKGGGEGQSSERIQAIQTSLIEKDKELQGLRSAVEQSEYEKQNLKRKLEQCRSAQGKKPKVHSSPLLGHVMMDKMQEAAIICLGAIRGLPSIKQNHRPYIREQ